MFQWGGGFAFNCFSFARIWAILQILTNPQNRRFIRLNKYNGSCWFGFFLSWDWIYIYRYCYCWMVFWMNPDSWRITSPCWDCDRPHPWQGDSGNEPRCPALASVGGSPLAPGLPVLVEQPHSCFSLTIVYVLIPADKTDSFLNYKIITRQEKKVSINVECMTEIQE